MCFLRTTHRKCVFYVILLFCGILCLFMIKPKKLNFCFSLYLPIKSTFCWICGILKIRQKQALNSKKPFFRRTGPRRIFSKKVFRISVRNIFKYFPFLSRNSKLYTFFRNSAIFAKFTKKCKICAKSAFFAQILQKSAFFGWNPKFTGFKFKKCRFSSLPPLGVSFPKSEILYIIFGKFSHYARTIARTNLQ